MAFLQNRTPFHYVRDYEPRAVRHGQYASVRSEPRSLAEWRCFQNRTPFHYVRDYEPKAGRHDTRGRFLTPSYSLSSAFRNEASGLVFTTSFFSSHPRRAVQTP